MLVIPMFLFPFDVPLAAAMIAGLWLSHHYHWPRNATVRRLHRLVARDRV